MKVWIPRVTEDYRHWKAMLPIAKSLSAKYGLELSADVQMPAGELMIVGSHMLKQHLGLHGGGIENGSILVNTEIELDAWEGSWGYKRIDAVWENGEKWGDFEPLVPYPAEIYGDSTACDVLFTGAVNERRYKILQGLADRGLKVLVLQNDYDAAHAARRGAKVILDCHYYLPDEWTTRFQVARVLEGMLYGKCVVSESCGGFYEDALKGGYVYSTYDDLISTVERCVRDTVRPDIELALSNLDKKAGEIRCL